jgi:5-methylcytosine-specific restriction endonuclease McrA
VPAAVRRAVWNRDGGRCAFVGSGGRCDESAFLEFHHVIPFAAGGPTTTENLELRCRAHNAYEAALDFGG